MSPVERIFKVNPMFIISILCLLSYTQSALFNSTYNISEPVKEYSTELAKYFLNFAGFKNCTAEQALSVNCCTSSLKKSGWELYAYYQNITEFNYYFSIFKNDENKKIVVAFPGTVSYEQLFTEFMTNKTTAFQGDESLRVYQYAFGIYQHIQRMFYGSMKDLNEKYSNYQYIFTGHSLGAGMATIFAMDAARSGVINKTEISPVLISYASFRVGNDAFANEVMKFVPIVYRVVGYGDPVPQVPVCNRATHGRTQINSFLSSPQLDIFSQINYLKSDRNYVCETFLPNSLFDSNFRLNNQQINAELLENFMWHTGGLKLYNQGFTSYVDCGNLQGENFSNPDCYNVFTL